jgi:hypothetical protein
LTRVLPLPRIAGMAMVIDAAGGSTGRPGGALMARGRVPVLWITGSAGVGKSTVSWQLFTELAGSGTRVAFTDADQLCMCYPPPPDDPGRDLIRARNADVTIRNYQAAGARRVIVTGVVDPALGVQRDLLKQAAVMMCRLRTDQDEVVRENQAVLHAYAAALPSAVVTTCRLHAGPAELRRRIMTRGEGGSWPQPGDPLRGQPASYLSRVAEQAAADAQALDRTPSMPCASTPTGTRQAKPPT